MEKKDLTGGSVCSGENLAVDKARQSYLFFGPISKADVAQMVEQLICNQQVLGSIPGIGFFCA